MRHVVFALLLASAVVASPSGARAASFAVDSSAFWDGGAIPPIDAASVDGCRGRNVSPPLRMTGVPPAARSLAVIVFDSDADGHRGFVHWVGYGIAPHLATLPSGFGTSARFVGGRNDAGTLQYFGPCPPAGDPAHHYAFSIYALTLAPGALPPGLSRPALLRAMAGHTVAIGTIVGTFAR